MTFRLALLALLAFPGCTAVLDIGGLQNGDAGADVGPRDGGPDARLDVGPIDAPPMPDAPIDAGEVDAFVPDEDAGTVDGGTEDDAGVPVDAGTDASVPVDAGTDAGVPVDAGTDAGVPVDAGTDAGVAVDAGTDAGVRTDAGPTPTVGISGTVVGLPAGSTVRLRNGAQTLDVVGPATGFTMNVPMGSTYDIDVDTAPSTLLCVIYRGTGTATAAVSNLFLGCSTAVNLETYMPFAGNDDPSRGRDWNGGATGTVPLITDRAGQPMNAVGAGGTYDRRMDYAIDARGSGVPAGTAQLTVSMWARIPAGLTAPSGNHDSLFSHVSFVLSGESMNVNIDWSGGMRRFELYLYWDGGFDRAVTPTTTNLPFGEWHHVAFAVRGPGSTLSDFTREIYVDGVREGLTGTCCGFGDLRSTFMWIFFPGRIERDDVRIYSRELTDAEIAGIYAAENVP